MLNIKGERTTKTSLLKTFIKIYERIQKTFKMQIQDYFSADQIHTYGKLVDKLKNLPFVMDLTISSQIEEYVEASRSQMEDQDLETTRLAIINKIKNNVCTTPFSNFFKEEIEVMTKSNKEINQYARSDLKPDKR